MRNIGDRVQIEHYGDTGSITISLLGVISDAPKGYHYIKWDNTGASMHPCVDIHDAGKTPAQERLRLASELNEAALNFRSVIETDTSQIEYGTWVTVRKLMESIDQLTGQIVEQAEKDER